MNKALLFAVTSAMLGVAGCAAQAPGSCTIPASDPAANGMICTDFGAGYTSDSVMQGCASSPPSSYSAAACPTASRVGRCTVTITNSSGESGTSTFNYYAPTTTDVAMQACSSNLGITGVDSATFAAN